MLPLSGCGGAWAESLPDVAWQSGREQFGGWGRGTLNFRVRFKAKSDGSVLPEKG